MKRDKKILIIIISSILIMLSLLTLFLINANKNKSKEEVITTTSTIKIKENFKEIIDEQTKISVKLFDEKYFNNKLLIENIENVVIENIILAYDINLLDENNNKVQVEDTNILISIPYLNVDKYSQFKVLYIDENNNVLETLNASYENGKIVFNVNHLSRYAILGIKDDEKTTTPQKNNITDKDSITSNNTTTTKKINTTNSSVSQTEKVNKKWKITLYAPGHEKVYKIIEVEDNKIAEKPKMPILIDDKYITEWHCDGKEFDFSEKITKDYVCYPLWTSISGSDGPTTTTQTQYETKVIITHESGQKEIKPDGRQSYNIYYQSGEMLKNIHVKGNPNYTYVLTKGDSLDTREYGVPHDFGGSSDPLWNTLGDSRYDIKIYYYDENSNKNYLTRIKLYYIWFLLGGRVSGDTYETTVNKSTSLKISGDNYGDISCISSDESNLVIDYTNTTLNFTPKEKGLYSITCKESTYNVTRILNVSAE